MSAALEGVVYRHQNSAQTADGEIDAQEIGAVAGQDGDAIAFCQGRAAPAHPLSARPARQRRGG